MRGAAVVMPAAPCFLLKTPKTQCLVWRGPLLGGRTPPTRQRENPARREARRIFSNPIRSGSGSRRPRRAVARIALEEQGLAGDSGNHRRLERLGDQEGRFRALAGQEAFRIGGGGHHPDPRKPPKPAYG